ncbi:MAG TPA: hypothetical protein VK438_06125 [Xanthobacteraceae bacterium]|nr:hypothetical protein [Xanthobacteraceae bacterium]
MFEIAKPTAAMKLLHWTKELPKASDSDPLGLELRLSARLSNELLFCITSITPRARYYSFFPWAFQDYNEHERSMRGDRGRIRGVLMRERAMVLGAVLHHDGQPCADGALGGTGAAVNQAKKNLRSYDLSKMKHLKSPQGQFGAAYKGSLINLGVFKAPAEPVADDVQEDGAELPEETQSIDVRELSPLGKRLADAFGKSVRGAAYVSEQLTRKDTVAANVLREFGSKAGLCEIAKKGAKDRDVLRDVFFARAEGMDRGGHQRRRMSLLLLLDCVGRTLKAGTSLDNRTFNDICYFGAVLSEGNLSKVIPIKLPAPLSDIQQRWRIFFTQSYFAVALQSLLVACIRQLRGKAGGLHHDQLIRSLSTPALGTRFTEVCGQNLPQDFFEMTARETLTACGATQDGQVVQSLPIDAPLSERQLEKYLVEGEANDVAAVALATMLLYQMAVRHQQRAPVQYDNWYRQQIINDYADLALPGVLRFLQGEFGDNWLDRTNAEILSRLIWRFVIRQHQTMSYERGFGGGAPLFHVDGMTVVGTDTDFTNPEARNSRFPSALQILTDLGFIGFDDDQGYQRTPDGDAWLAAELGTG